MSSRSLYWTIGLRRFDGGDPRLSVRRRRALRRSFEGWSEMRVELMRFPEKGLHDHGPALFGWFSELGCRFGLCRLSLDFLVLRLVIDPSYSWERDSCSCRMNHHSVLSFFYHCDRAGLRGREARSKDCRKHVWVEG